jgi:hypothetical protein
LLLWWIKSHAIGVHKFLIRLTKPGHYQMLEYVLSP